MDIKKVNDNNQNSRLKIIVLGTLLSLAFAFYVYSSNEQTINYSDVVLSTVKSGNLKVTVDGYGFLKSNKQKLITAQSQSTVTEILLKPGQQVKEDSIILILENIDLINEKDSSDLEFKAEQSNLRELILNQKRELLEEKSEHAELVASYESTKYQRKATESLVESGTVPKLDFVKLELKEQQLKERIEFQLEGLQQLSLLHNEAINIQNEKIKIKELKTKATNKKVSDLIVKAGHAGVIQELPVELGQTLGKGEQIALIGDDEDLLASIRIPQSKIHLIEVGFPVIIDTRQDEIIGIVSRIEPGVVDSYVTIEVDLPQSLPASARPELNVDAQITTKTIENALFIDKPVNIPENSIGNLFLFDESSNIARKKNISFGVEAGRFLQIKSGAILNDVFIISDLSKIDKDKITIK